MNNNEDNKTKITSIEIDDRALNMDCDISLQSTRSVMQFHSEINKLIENHKSQTEDVHIAKNVQTMKIIAKHCPEDSDIIHGFLGHCAVSVSNNIAKNMADYGEYRLNRTDIQKLKDISHELSSYIERSKKAIRKEYGLGLKDGISQLDRKNSTPPKPSISRSGVLSR